MQDQPSKACGITSPQNALLGRPLSLPCGGNRFPDEYYIKEPASLGCPHPVEIKLAEFIGYLRVLYPNRIFKNELRIVHWTSGEVLYTLNDLDLKLKFSTYSFTVGDKVLDWMTIELFIAAMRDNDFYDPNENHRKFGSPKSDQGWDSDRFEDDFDGPIGLLQQTA